MLSAPVPPVTADRSPEWGSDDLDLDAYLERIGYTGSREPTAESLAELHARHMATISFENVDMAVGRPVGVDIDSIQDKLVRRGRGGYCYETNLLYAAALDRFGFPVTRMLCRIREGSSKRRFRSHTAMLVRTGRTVWMSDPGYGYAGPTRPMPLVADVPLTAGNWSWRLGVEDDGHWVLQDRTPDGWVDLFAFRPEPQYEVDFQAAHYVSSTRPGSPFVGHLVVQRGGETVRHRLRDDMLLTQHAPGAGEERTLTGREVVETLRGTFGLELTSEDELLVLRFVATVKARER